MDQSRGIAPIDHLVNARIRPRWHDEWKHNSRLLRPVSCDVGRPCPFQSHFPPQNATLHLASFKWRPRLSVVLWRRSTFSCTAIWPSSFQAFLSGSQFHSFSAPGLWFIWSVVCCKAAGSGCFGRLCRSSRPKKALTLSIQLMMAGTATMALMPPFASIGIVAAIGVFVARLLQGFSVGGEIGSSTAFMVEQTKGRKGLFGSWRAVSANSAKLLSSFFGIFLTTAMSPAQLSAWGWRVPFLFAPNRSRGPVHPPTCAGTVRRDNSGARSCSPSAFHR